MQDYPDKTLLQKMHDTETHYRLLIESLPAAVYATDTEGKITLYNKAAVALWGREPEPAKDYWSGAWKLFTTNGSPLAHDNCPMAVAVKEKRPVEGTEIIIERPDGSRRLVAHHPRPVFNDAGEITGAVNMLVDISAVRETDLQNKSKELRSEERYHRMIDEVEDYAILLLDSEGLIQDWNKGAEKIKGYKESEIVGKHLRVFYLPEDQQRKLPEQLIAEAIKNGKAIHEGWRVRKDRSLFWGSIVITALHDEQNNVIGFSKVTRDLTEKKLAEDKIRQYASELEFQNKELEHFAYVAAHDMKEPLRKIQFYNGYINEHGTLAGKTKEYLQRSINAASRMQILIDDLLMYSKVTSFTPVFEVLDLNIAMKEVLSGHQDIIEKTGATTSIGHLPTIKVIPFQFTQLLNNLLGNSFKYRHPERSPHIVITAEEIKRFAPGSNQQAPLKTYHRIAIADNGIGFEQQHSSRIFELFQRLHDLTEYTGTGIGLAICKKIIENHGGFIESFGVPGKGAVFTIFVPV
jgi:PAS domain S-box-containing protein